MEQNIWQEKIAGLPEFVQQQIADYIDFLVEKYKTKDDVLNEKDKQILEERYAAYRKSNKQSAGLEDVKEKLNKKYGL